MDRCRTRPARRHVHRTEGDLRSLGDIAAQTGGGLRLQVEDVLANDARAVVLVVATGSRGARRLNERQVAVFDLNEDKVHTARFIYEDPDAYDEFWTD